MVTWLGNRIAIMQLMPTIKIKAYATRFLALIFLCLIAACDNTPDERPLRHSANAWIGYEPFFTAEAKGFYDPGSVHLIETPFSLTLEQALRAGTIDASAVSLSRAFTLVSEGYDITIVLVLDWSNGADKLLAAPHIKVVEDLKGKRIGIEPRTVNTYLLLRALQESSLELQDVTLVPMLNEALHDAYMTGDIAAASVFGPKATLMEQAGAHSIFDSSMIPGEIIDVLIVRTAYLHKHSKRVEQLISGWLKAVEYLNNLPEGSDRVPGLLSEIDFTGTIDDIRLAGLEDNRSFLEADATRLRAVLNARREFRASMKQSLQMGILPPIDPTPLMQLIGEGQN
jgi:NitT/TauT family transport system substrate-binding protein